MRTIVIAALLALSFTTGFTCSKNTPAESQPATPAAQEQMAAPAAPAEGAPAAAPTEGQAPSTENAAPTAPAETK